MGDKDRVEMYKSFRPADVVLARQTQKYIEICSVSLIDYHEYGRCSR